MTQINSYNGGAALPGNTVTRDKIKSLTLQHNPTDEGQATDVVYSPLEGKTVPVRNLVIKDKAGNTVGTYDPLANTATEIEIPDNGKVAVELGAVAGFLKDVLVSASDMVTLVPSGNQLRLNFDLTLPSDVVRDSAYKHIDAATSNPLMNGTAAVGVSTKYAREDHVHPSDTRKEDKVNKTTVVLGTSDSKYPTDKAVANFVNSSIATNTANYISNNGEPFTSVEQLEAYSGPVTNNDYAFVTGTDSDGNTYYDRYKATVKGSSVTWSLEYRLNNSSFTAAQWSAINSGITSVLVSKIHEHSNKAVLDGITSSDVANWNSKQNSLTAGDNITIDGNTISSDQVFVATYGTTTYQEIKDAHDAGKICLIFRNELFYYINLIDTNRIRFISQTPNPAFGMLTVFSNNRWEASNSWLQSKLTFDTEPNAGSNNPVTSDGIKKGLDNKLNVDGYNATKEGVTLMMRRVESGSEDLNDDSYYFGDSNNDHTQIVRRPILNIWNYIAGKVQRQLLGSVGFADKPIYLENGIPKVCADGVPYSSVSYGNTVGYGVFVGGAHNLENTTRCYCTFLISVASDPDKIAHTYIGTFTFRGGVLNSELKCLTGTPAYPHRIATIYNEDGKDSNGNPTYTVGLYVIPDDKTYNYSGYKLTRIASTNDFIWDVKNLSEAEYDECNSVAKPALRPIILTWDAIGSNVTTTGGTWLPTFDKATIIDCRGIVDISIQVDLSIIGQTTYIDTLSRYDITLVNSSGTDIIPALHQTGRMPRQTRSTTGGGTIDISCTHRFIFPISFETNLLAGYRPKINLPPNYTLDSGAQVSIRAICKGIVLPYGADKPF